MTLHNAIEEVLGMSNKAMSAKEISSMINLKKLYKKGDETEVLPNQISARANKYPNLFEVNRTSKPYVIKLIKR